jgi:LmbE family N-acetylglucosaminyl deacetylase
MIKKQNTVAVVVPHGDDESLGFAGAIQKHVSWGDSVHVVFCRGPQDERTTQQYHSIAESQKVLNYEKYHCLFVTEAEISNEPLKLFKKIEQSLLGINPDIVYTTFWGDIHQDHHITYDCVRRAVRVWGPLNVKQFYVGEIISSTDQHPSIDGFSFTPNHYIPITEKELQKKIDSLYCYKSELFSNPAHPRSERGIRNRAIIRGEECANEYAEAFITLRHIL